MDADEYARPSNDSPLLALPVEMLLHIFHIVSEEDMYAVDGSVDSVRLPEEPDSPSSLWNITHVCRMFRQLALSTTTLWTNLFIDLRLGLHDSDGDTLHLCPGGVACLRERIARSGTGRLKLHMRVGCHAIKRERESGDMKDFSQPIVTTLLANAERFTAIRLWTNSWANIAGISHLFRFGEFQALKVFDWGILSTVGRLSDRRSYRPVHFDALSYAKGLRYLGLPSFTPEFFHIICWTGLVHLAIGHVPAPEVPRLFTLLNTMKNLETLGVMFEAHVLDKDSLSLGQTTIHLPRLKHITVTGSYPLAAALLERLDAPQVESMTLSLSYRSHMSPLQMSRYLTLRQLSLSFRKCTGDPVESLGSILRSVPSLKHLFISATSNAQHCIRAAFDNLLDERLCPQLRRISVYSHTGDATSIVHTLRKRNRIHLDYTCQELIVEDGNGAQLKEFVTTGHLMLPNAQVLSALHS